MKEELMNKKTLLVTIGRNTEIKVKFSGEPITARELRLVQRAIKVEFRRYHYRLTHNKESPKEAGHG